MINYIKLLEMNNIFDVDYVDENGYFFRDFKDLSDNVKIGYSGKISYDENGTHILYTRLRYTIYEPYLTDTQAYNAEYDNKLIGVNIDNNDFEAKLSLDEGRDAETLYEEYIKNANLFNKKQRNLMKIYELELKISALNERKDKYKNRVKVIELMMEESPTRKKK